MRRNRFWGCWTQKPRPEGISPCGYDGKNTDLKCKGCADSPQTLRDKELDAAMRKVQDKWAKRWMK